MRAYKVFDFDWSCRGFSYLVDGMAIGTTHKLNEPIDLCLKGFHFCRKLSNCFSYKTFSPNNKVAEIKVTGNILGDPYDKECTDEFTIVRELSWEEVLKEVNSGDRNSGDSNSGDRNSGHWNSGDRNSGDRNSGDRNSGDSNSGDSNSGDRNSGHWNSGDRNSGHWNSGDRNSGHWNSGDRNSGVLNRNTSDKYRVFEKWISAQKFTTIKYPDFFYFDLIQWISHDVASEEEKIKYKKEIETSGGFIKTLDYKEAWKFSWNKANQLDREKLFKIPGFDKDIFFDITGIDVDL